MGKFSPEEIFIEKKIKNSALARGVIKKFPRVKIFEITTIKDYLKDAPAVSIERAKKKLFIARQKSGFIKPCPGTPRYLCCNYYILDLGFGCFYDCCYCYLQVYSNFPGIILYANLEDFFRAVEQSLKRNPLLFYRLGTGEFTDSLAFENIHSYARELIPFFSNKKIMLELKTKGDYVDNLLNLEHGGHSVISWSLNPPVIIRNEEKGSVSLDKRLKAARTCARAGYPVGFHFDPIITYPGWEEDYRQTVAEIFRYVSADSIVWISLGTLRFPPALQGIMARRFPKSKTIYAEFITGLDGKRRYFKPRRIDIYQKMVSWIKEIAPRVPLYLCMESQDVWKKVFGFSPGNPRAVEKLFLVDREKS